MAVAQALLIAASMVALQAATAAAATAPAWVASAPVPRPGLRSVTLDAMVAAARADAAQRSGVADAALEVLSAAPVTWPDGSLGCAQPGVRYTMALVSGYRIMIRAQTRTFDYHASQRGGLLLCPAGQSGEPAADSRI